MIGLRQLYAFTVAALVVFLLPTLAYADIARDGVCTDTGDFTINFSGGLISTIVINIRDILTAVSESMHRSVTGDAGFIYYVRALMTLYVMIYGVLFALGMVQMSIYDFGMRMLKFGIVGLLISGYSWNFFNGMVVPFFNQGVDDLINRVTSIAVGDQTYTGPTMMPDGSFYTVPPFYVIDGAVAIATSSRMAVTIAAIFTTGPYGVIYGLFIVLALGSFIKSLLHALWVYLMSLVMKTLLFGLAPIFISFLLFGQTRHLFDGWVNALVNASLQPLLLFLFFAFFAMIIQSALTDIISVPVCWTQMKESIRGTSFSQHYWRFKRDGQMYAGIWDFKDNFPIDIMTVLFFMMLADLCGKFNNTVVDIAADIAGAATNLSFPTRNGSPIDQLFAPARKSGGAKGASTGQRGAPGSGVRRGGTGLAGPGTADNPLDGIQRAMRDPVGDAARQAAANAGKRS